MAMEPTCQKYARLRSKVEGIPCMTATVFPSAIILALGSRLSEKPRVRLSLHNPTRSAAGLLTGMGVVRAPCAWVSTIISPPGSYAFAFAGVHLERASREGLFLPSITFARGERIPSSSLDGPIFLFFSIRRDLIPRGLDKRGHLWDFVTFGVHFADPVLRPRTAASTLGSGGSEAGRERELRGLRCQEALG
ncbi:uncharacterized protein LY79DRAFT_565933 [Colletotrichum navitas]|uniref:Uncharacterized protein n=1 Tax=Colletotrichum navitas TaxID=681940 RepID=A0AAD8PRP5_9PEZI|nr:uncharacterized protein LY79DRAFT_565933 [Colletotrichum navitas]KAK1574444.1 hypothetical protein LY79DRAFT_565933 [Colletotrichum navitas]